ncbi:MAG TPA: helix-turn-helix transcriptional regulator [Solirubrobacterales bacterium]|nr:helix-turn-helix transcriptional regulator [Solirubrobacterales bacterium]
MADSLDLVRQRFGRNLRAARRRVGMSQEDLGWYATLHRTEIGLLERGDRVPRIDTLIKLSAALSMLPGDLLEGIDFELDATARGPRTPSGLFRVASDNG